MKNSGWACCSLVDSVENRADLVHRLVGVAADLELDERRVPVWRDLARVVRVERRANVLDRVERLEPRDDVRDRGREGRVARSQRVALDQDALAGGLLEARVEDPVHPTGLARPRRRSGRSIFVPASPPSAKATRTNASQPNVAVFQWSALQRPIRAARLRAARRAPAWCDIVS